MLTRTTHDLRKQQQRTPRRRFCLFPRWLDDGRVVWLDYVWSIRTDKWDIDWTWSHYLTYDEALINGYWYKKEALPPTALTKTQPKNPVDNPEH